MNRAIAISLVALVCTVSFTSRLAAQSAYTKAYVADRIRKVEDGVDEFRKWAEKRGEGAHAGNRGFVPTRNSVLTETVAVTGSACYRPELCTLS